MVRIRRGQDRKPTVPGRYIVERAERAKARDPSLTYKDIARSFNINERTLRKLRTGETSGRATFRKGKRIPEPTQPDLFTIQLRRLDGTYATVDVVVQGGGRLTTFDTYDVAQLPETRQAIEQELVKRSVRKRALGYEYYATDEAIAGTRIVGARRVANQRRIPVIIRGMVRGTIQL